MFSAALMLWLIYHKTTSGDKHRHDPFVWCCGSEEKEVHPSGGARSTARRRKWRRRRGGSWAPRSMSGRNSHKNSNKCPVGYQNTFGGDLMTESVTFILKYWWMKTICLQPKGHFPHTGQKGRSLSTTRALSVHVPELYIYMFEIKQVYIHLVNYF